MGEDEEAARHVRRKGSSADLSSARSRLPIRFSLSLSFSLCLSLSLNSLLSLFLFLSVHRRKCSYESLIPSVYSGRLAVRQGVGVYIRMHVCAYNALHARGSDTLRYLS